MERDEDEARSRREAKEGRLGALHPAEWSEWVRLKPVLDLPIPFGFNVYDFTDFLKDVGPRPAAGYRLVRADKSKSYDPENLKWVARKAKTPTSPYLNAKQAAALMGISVGTLYNNRRHIPSLPGSAKLLFDKSVLEGLLRSPRFKSKRSAGGRKAKKPV